MSSNRAFDDNGAGVIDYHWSVSTRLYPLTPVEIACLSEHSLRREAA